MFTDNTPFADKSDGTAFDRIIKAVEMWCVVEVRMFARNRLIVFGLYTRDSVPLFQAATIYEELQQLIAAGKQGDKSFVVKWCADTNNIGIPIPVALWRLADDLLEQQFNAVQSAGLGDHPARIVPSLILDPNIKIIINVSRSLTSPARGAFGKKDDTFGMLRPARPFKTW